MVGCTVLARGLGFVISSMRLFKATILGCTTRRTSLLPITSEFSAFAAHDHQASRGGAAATTLHSLRPYSSSTASMTSGRSDATARDRASSCNESSMRTSNFDKRASTDGPVSAPLDAVGDRMIHRAERYLRRAHGWPCERSHPSRFAEAKEVAQPS